MVLILNVHENNYLFVSEINNNNNHINNKNNNNREKSK